MSKFEGFSNADPRLVPRRGVDALHSGQMPDDHFVSDRGAHRPQGFIPPSKLSAHAASTPGRVLVLLYAWHVRLAHRLRLD